MLTVFRRERKMGIGTERVRSRRRGEPSQDLLSTDSFGPSLQKCQRNKVEKLTSDNQRR